MSTHDPILRKSVVEPDQDVDTFEAYRPKRVPNLPRSQEHSSRSRSIREKLYAARIGLLSLITVGVLVNLVHDYISADENERDRLEATESNLLGSIAKVETIQLDADIEIGDRKVLYEPDPKSGVFDVLDIAVFRDPILLTAQNGSSWLGAYCHQADAGRDMTLKNVDPSQLCWIEYDPEDLRNSRGTFVLDSESIFTGRVAQEADD